MHYIDTLGQLSMLVDVDEAGVPASVSVLKSPDDRLTKYVAAVLMEEKFKPGICGGLPCKMPFPFRMNFKRGNR
jgi:hypothetical protein